MIRPRDEEMDEEELQFSWHVDSAWIPVGGNQWFKKWLCCLQMFTCFAGDPAGFAEVGRFITKIEEPAEGCDVTLQSTKMLIAFVIGDPDIDHQVFAGMTLGICGWLTCWGCWKS